MSVLKKFLSLAAAASVLASVPVAVAQDDPRAEPRAELNKLEGILGAWNASTFIMEENGWRRLSEAEVVIERSLKGLLIVEHETGRAEDGEFPAMKLDISFDQYRDVYRLAVMDDQWGLMDIYEGELAGDALTATNLRADTGFPLGDGRTMYFKLVIPTKGDERVMMIDTSLDGGETWQDFYKVIYTRP